MGFAACAGVAATDADAVVAAARDFRADLVVVGPDAALEAGVVDACLAAGIAAFGPTAEAARLETSKVFAKTVMRDAGIPTAAWAQADAHDRTAARDFIRLHGGNVVVKADGLALGKGVTVCDAIGTAEDALAECLDARRFGSAGATVVVEERLSGRELSVFAICDGERARLLPPACDYKRALDGDAGPNTGGMGAYTPPHDLDSISVVNRAADEVVGPCLDVMRQRGTPFRGCLYVGLMLTPDGPRVLEFNARFGDPETQALMPLIAEDMADLLMASAAGTVTPGRVAVAAAASVCVVATTAEYPAAGSRGMPITLPALHDPDTFLFHAGTTLTPDGAVQVAGGRVINVVGRGATVAAARQRAYATIRGVEFAGVRWRNDIAAFAGQDSVGGR